MGFDEPEDVGDEKQVKHKKARHVLAREQEVEEARVLLSSYGGRAFIWRLLEQCKVHDFGYCGDNNMLNNMEGRRAVGGWIINEVFTADPEAYTLLRNEAVSRDTVRRRKK